MPPRTFIHLLTTALLTVGALAQSKFEINSLQPCTEQQNDKWKQLQTEFNGVLAKNPDTSVTAQYSAGRFGYFGVYLFPSNWMPLSDSKHTMCGRFARFDWNVIPVINDIGLSDENDWNIRIIPSDLFRDTFNDALPYSTKPTEVWSCDPMPKDDRDRHQCGETGGVEYKCTDSPANATPGALPGGNCHNCFEAELTPRTNRFQTPWFKKNQPSGACSTLVDQSICVYGPYVTESVHGNRPEIHPIEALWWRNNQHASPDSPDEQSWTLLHVQDASHRFDDRSDFSPLPRDDSADWAPWAAPNQSAQFDLFFETPTSPQQPVEFQMNELMADGIVPLGTTPRQIFVFYSGQQIFTMSQVQPDTNHFAVTQVSGVCATPGNNIRVQVRIQSTVGTVAHGGRTAEFGFQALQIWNAKSPNPTPAQAQANFLELAPAAARRLRINPKTITANIVNGKLRVTARAERPQTFALHPQKAPSEQREVDIQSLLSPGNSVVLATKVLSINTNPTKSPSASRLLSGFLGRDATVENLAGHVSDVVVTAAPQLVILRDGRPAWEDSDELFSDFNAKLARAGRSGQRSMLNWRDVPSDWTYIAWNCGEHPDKGCATKTKLDVIKVRSRETRAVYVSEDFDGAVPRFHVEFPGGPLAETLIWLQATGPKLLDGSSPEVLNFFNIGIPVTDDSDEETERMVASLATFLNVPGVKLGAGPAGDSSDPFLDNPRFRLADMLRMQIKHAAEGNVIEPQVWSLFLTQAERLASLP
jgi:hypothetical protein